MATAATRHPAKFSDAFLPVFADLLKGCDRVLDPFAGTGKLALIRDYGYTGAIYLNELEPEWAHQTPFHVLNYVTIGDAEHLPYGDKFFSAVCTSCSYANRMADHHNAKDGSRRNTYKHALGRDLTEGNTGMMQWGEEYRRKHEAVWRECKRVLGPSRPLDDGGNLLILNISDHIRKGEVVPVTQWHIDTLISLGFALQEHRKIPTPRLRYGANGGARVEHESIVVLRQAR